MNRRFTVLAGAEANQFFHREGARVFRTFEAWVGMNETFGAARSILTTDGTDHAVFRRMLKRGYSRRYAEDRVFELIDIARREISDWPDGAPFAVVPAFRRIASEQVGGLTTGMSPRAYGEDLPGPFFCRDRVPATGAGLPAAGSTAAPRGPAWHSDRKCSPKWAAEHAPVTPLPDNGIALEDLPRFVHGLLASLIVPRPTILRSSSFRRASRRVDDLYREVIARHPRDRRELEGAPDLIDDILDMHEADPRFLPEADLKMSVLGPFIAALDTVASTCAFMLYELLMNPGIMARVLSEADSLFAAGPPSWSDVRAMDALHCAAIETMRMHPVAPLLIRTATNTFEFGGHRVTAGEWVMIATTIPHSLREFFPEPDRFDIGRYAPDRLEHWQPFAYAPFGLGAHRCLGNGFAEVQIAVTMATILHNAEIELHPASYRLKTTQLPLPSPDRSFRIRAIPRNGSVF